MFLTLSQVCSGNAAIKVRFTVQPFAGNHRPNFRVEYKTCGEAIKGGQLFQQLQSREISENKPSSHVHYTYTSTWSYPPQFWIGNAHAWSGGPRVFDVEPEGGFWGVVNHGPATVRVEFQPVNGLAYLDA